MQTTSSTLTPIQWALKACEAIMDTFEPEHLPPDRFHYHQGVFYPGWRNVGDKPENKSSMIT